MADTAPTVVSGLYRPRCRSDEFDLVLTHAEVPPLPSHISVEQAKQMAQALLKRDPNAARIIKQSLKGKLQEFVNR